MKTIQAIILFISLSISTFAQLGVTINTKSETTIDYKIKRFRIGITFDPNENQTEMIMPAIKYELIQQDDHVIYTGCTLINIDNISSVRIPVGINYFPFTKNNFGLTMELNGCYGKEYQWDLPDGYDDKLFIRGSLGFIYRL